MRTNSATTVSVPDASRDPSGATWRPTTDAIRGERIQRYFHAHLGLEAVKIGVGHHYASVGDELIIGVCGAGVILCAVDPEARVGGMIHVLLADGAEHAAATLTQVQRFVSDLRVSGAALERIEISLFGGAHTQEGDIKRAALRTVVFAHGLPGQLGIKLRSHDLRGANARKIYFRPVNAEIRLKRLEYLANDTIQQRDLGWLTRK